jgi:hypothetical protein
MLKNKCCLYVIISIRFFSITICNLLIELPSYFRLTLPINCTRWYWKYKRYVSSKFGITWKHVRGSGWFQPFHFKLTVCSNAAVPWLLSANGSLLLQLCATFQSIAVTYSFLWKGHLTYLHFQIDRLVANTSKQFVDMKSFYVTSALCVCLCTSTRLASTVMESRYSRVRKNVT